MIAIVAIVVGGISLILGLVTFFKTESWRRRLRIELNQLADDSQAFLIQLCKSSASDDLKDRYSNLNHALAVHLISFDKALAQQWIKKNIPENKWTIWETNLQVSMDKHRKKQKNFGIDATKRL